ncbi:hypothetical protein A1O1_03001 [Capronia coronata CBS 617.96]|uniref:Uncharacterized protein n=1 Tax=Capronia coronata CBS 617.96 TaxID=1182541 RepID=W9YY43_9EURO|nr:uncharacterized protein A1O1_03001 [Capronia coronata CBS 617.96]EXJ94605.1 hypothetical protein A1O1_03001 [Capronia coronata CBS 617.96]
MKPSDKKRSVPNGGLGGLVLPQLGAGGREVADVASQPPSKKSESRRRPPPIRIFCGGDNDPTWPAPAYGGSSIGLGGLWTPNTPTDRLGLSYLAERDLSPGSAPWTSHHESAAPRAPCCSLPETPISPLNSPPVELPGSLLQPSQGFPQTTPISPPPSLRIVRRDTEDSTVSSVPTLSTSLSSDVDTMETFRNLTTPLRKHDRTPDSTMPGYVIGSRADEGDSSITKPLSAMSIDELLDSLPECNPSVVTQLWLPAVRAQFQKMIDLLNDVGELKIESSLNQIAFQKDLKSFSDEIRLIATSYHKVLESAESLVERDTKVCHERLKELEAQVEEALNKMEAKDEEIAEQARTNADLTHTIRDIVHILGSFIHDYVSSWVGSINEPRTEQVLEIISDYARYSDCKNESIPYVRVPKSTIAQYTKEVRESQAVAKEYRELLHEQSAMIHEHSRNLDVYTNKYEVAVRVIKEREHEVLLLVQNTDTLTSRLEECEAALAQSQESIAELESSAGRYDELRGNMESLKIAHTLEIGQRDEEIARLRQMLGSAREEVFARRADVKNIISQTQAGLAVPDMPSAATARAGPTSKALRFFGMDRDKERGRRPALPSSQSMIGFTSSHHDATTQPLDTRYSSKEVAPVKSKSFLRNVSPLGRRRQAQTTPNTPVDSSDSGSGSMASLPVHVGISPRSDSLGATQRHGVLASPINTRKALPQPPARPQPQFASAARLAAITQAVESPNAMQIASDYLEHSILGQTQTVARRVLSKIPELSIHSPSQAGDATDDRLSGSDNDNVDDDEAESVASSDREVYRKSVCALDMLNASTLPCSETETETEFERILRGVGVGVTGKRGGNEQQEREYRGHHHDEEDGYVDGDDDELQTGVARVLHLRRGNHDLRALRDREQDGSGSDRDRDRDHDRRERYRYSFLSDASGERSEGSEPKTVAQLYHQGGHRHI